MNGSSRAVGYVAVVSAVTIWGAWVVLTRHAVIGALTPASVALLRVGVPTIILAPVLFRISLWPKGKTIPFLLCIMGAGLPFLILMGYAMRRAPAADIGPLVPGTMPLLVALISVVVFKERMGWARAAGFALCAAGIAIVGGRSLLTANADVSIGHAMLLVGALWWACYTISFRLVGISAIEMTALIGFWSTLAVLPFGVPQLIDAYQQGAINEILLQVLIQGIGSGLVALVLFNIGIARLGASRAAAFVALVPALATLIAIPVLKEIPDAASIFGVVTTGAGVLLASGVLNEIFSAKKPVE